CILADDHVLVPSKLDGLDVMRENAFGDFFGFKTGCAPDGFDDIRRDLYQGLNVEITANVLDQLVKAVLHFHSAAELESTIRRIQLAITFLPHVIRSSV